MLPQDLKNYRAEDDAFSLGISGDRLVMALVIIIALGAIFGCASMDHQWTKARPESVKPWLYVTVQDVDRACRDAGAPTEGIDRINACATWKPTGCIIYLPPNAPRWIIEHEEKHCAGFTHD